MQLLRQFKGWLGRRFPLNNSNLDSTTERSQTSARFKSDPSQQLVKSRPLSLEDRYQIIKDPREVEAVFSKLTAALVDLSDSLSSAARAGGSSPVVLRQIGVTGDRRPYVFMKPMSRPGWLFEMGPAGWRISNAEQIISREMFMRSHMEPWDVVTIWVDPRGEGLTRVQSQRFGRDLMIISEYERRVCESMRDLFNHGSDH
jgi:hypothetical protein